MMIVEQMLKNAQTPLLHIAKVESDLPELIEQEKINISKQFCPF